MALAKDIKTVYGVELKNAYLRVENVRLENKENIAFSVCVYADKSKSAIEAKPYACVYDIDGANPIAQAYNYLKTLPEFAGAIDC